MTMHVAVVVCLLVLSLCTGAESDCEVDGPDMVKSMVHEWQDLTNRWSEGYKYFIQPPVLALIKFTLFEVSNHQEVIAGLENPFLIERGPYVYREERFKEDLHWNTTEFLEFGQYKMYNFVPEKSCEGCTEDDQVRILNMPLAQQIAKFVGMGGLTAVGGLNSIEKMLESREDELFPLTNVGDFLFRGINTGVAGWMMSQSLTKDRLPPMFRPENGFAFFNGKQESSENECYQVETSAESWDRHTMITKWGRDMVSLSEDLSTAETCSWTGKYCQSWWPNADADGNTRENSTCNEIRGTDGTQFPPFINKQGQEDLWVFSTLPCRSVAMKYMADVTIEGVPGLAWRIPSDAANINKTRNVCACQELSDLVSSGDPCVKTMDADQGTLDISNCSITSCYDGLQDITLCQGTPTLLSYPHFYLADAQRANFDGLSPDSSLHRTYLIVEPASGLSLRHHARYQFNVPVFNSEDLPTPVTTLTNIATVPAFPVLWVDEGTDETCH